MKHHAGIDVSLDASHVCVVDGAGRILRDAQILGEPAALVAWFGGFEKPIGRIGLEAGPTS